LIWNFRSCGRSTACFLRTRARKRL